MPTQSPAERMAEVNATLEEISDHFKPPDARFDPDNDDDNIHIIGARNERRPFMSLVLFGHQIASMSRPFYERLPRFLRSLADNLLTSNKGD